MLTPHLCVGVVLRYNTNLRTRPEINQAVMGADINNHKQVTDQRCWAHFPDPENPQGPYLDCQNMTAGRYMNKHTGKYLYACLDHSMHLTSTWIHAPEIS